MKKYIIFKKKDTQGGNLKMSITLVWDKVYWKENKLAAANTNVAFQFKSWLESEWILKNHPL